MSKSSSTVSDAAVDLEKGTAALKEVEKEELDIVDPLKTMLANRVMDAVFLLYVVFFAGLVAYLSKFGKNWWSELLLTVLALSPVMILCFWMIHQLRKVVLFLVKKRSVGSGNDLSTKLLASEK